MQNRPVIKVAIDAMGGDLGPSVTVPAAIDALKAYPSLRLTLVGDSASLKNELKRFEVPPGRLSILHASQVVQMDESPALALRNKKDSSMRVAVNLVSEGAVHACVSAGNTGALMAIARFVLKMLPGIDRPAIISSLPTIHPNKFFRMLDLGANVDSTPKHLFEFAVMASAMASAVQGVNHPKVSLLNIGAESIKGNELVKQTAELLSKSDLVNYAGFIEADAMFRGATDIVVCDGFVGNVSLKSSEGIAKLILQLMKQAFMQSAWTRFLGWLAKPIFKSVSNLIDPSRYNGATFLGLNGIVIKSHGGAAQSAFANAIGEAFLMAEQNVLERIKHQLATLLSNSNPTLTSSPPSEE